MPRLTGEQLRAAKAVKAEKVSRALIQACLGEERDVQFARDEIDKIFSVAIEFALWIWFDEILPKHFGPGAMEKYGYPLRKEGYLIGKFTGKTMSGKPSRFRFPKSVAYKMAAGGKDPFPLDFTGELKGRVTSAPATPPKVTRMTGGYRGRIVISLPAYTRQADIAAVIRYLPEDIAKMMTAVQFVVKGSLGNA